MHAVVKLLVYQGTPEVIDVVVFLLQELQMLILVLHMH